MLKERCEERERKERKDGAGEIGWSKEVEVRELTSGLVAKYLLVFRHLNSSRAV